MAQELINVGASPGDGTGDGIRTSFTKCNNNFTDLFKLTPGGVVYVDSLDDLPEPSGNLISLDGNVTYVFTGIVDLGINQLNILSSTRVTLLSLSPFLGGWTSIRTDASIVIDGEAYLERISMFTPAGRAFQIAGSTPNVTFRSCVFESASSTSLVGSDAFLSMDGCQFENHVNGCLLYSGSNHQSFLSDNSFGAGTAGNIISLGAAQFLAFKLTGSRYVSTLANVFINGLEDSGNMVAPNIGIIQGNLAFGVEPPIASITPSDYRWNFVDNNLIDDSSISAETDLNVQETVTVTQNIYVPIGGTSWTDGVLERFEASNSGILTHKYPKRSRVLIIGNTTLDKVGGGQDQLATQIAINGVPQPSTISSTQNNQPTSIVSQGLFELEEDDEVQLYVTNLSSNSNVNVFHSSLVCIRSS